MSNKKRWYTKLNIRITRQSTAVSCGQEAERTQLLLAEQCEIFIANNKFDMPTCILNCMEWHRCWKQQQHQQAQEKALFIILTGSFECITIITDYS